MLEGLSEDITGFNETNQHTFGKRRLKRQPWWAGFRAWELPVIKLDALIRQVRQNSDPAADS
jgi:hypothetical protein